MPPKRNFAPCETLRRVSDRKRLARRFTRLDQPSPTTAPRQRCDSISPLRTPCPTPPRADPSFTYPRRKSLPCLDPARAPHGPVPPGRAHSHREAPKARQERLPSGVSPWITRTTYSAHPATKQPRASETMERPPCWWRDSGAATTSSTPSARNLHHGTKPASCSKNPSKNDTIQSGHHPNLEFFFLPP
jgi:hypothetical protein